MFENYESVIRFALRRAQGMCWDECHKIYILMDLVQVDQLQGYGYEIVAPDFDVLANWYAESCWLKFVQAIDTVEGDANKGFTDLVPQGAVWEPV